MAGVSTAFKKIFLRNLKWGSEDANISLLEAFKQFAKASADDSVADVVLSGTSANGASVNYIVPSSGRLQAQTRAELAEEYIELYETAKTEKPAATDAEIFCAMLAVFSKRTTYAVDWRGLRQ